MTSALRRSFLLAILPVGACTADDTKSSETSTTTTADTASPPSERPDPAERGPFLPATRTDTITTATGQTLTVQTWYPSAPETTGSEHIYDGLMAGTALDETAPDCSEPRPVVMFSHGNGGLRYQSIFLTEHLASRGWVVVAPDHEGNTVFDLDTSRWGELAVRRPLDISQSFDWLADTLSAAGGALEGCIDPGAGFAVVGHSFGGYTATALVSATLTAEHAADCKPGWLCKEVAEYLSENPDADPADLRDARVWASVPMTPAAFELLEPSLPSANAPMLVFGGTRDDITPVAFQVEPIYSGAGVTPKYLAVVEDAGHYTFSDACKLLPTYPDCSAPYLDLDVAHTLINGVTTAFLEHTAGMNIDTAGWLPPEDPLVNWQAAE